MADLETCLRAWPRVIARTPLGSQDHEFAMKIEAQALRPGWAPGQIALGYMRDLVAKYAPEARRFVAICRTRSELRWTRRF